MSGIINLQRPLNPLIFHIEIRELAQNVRIVRNMLHKQADLQTDRTGQHTGGKKSNFSTVIK